MNTIDAKLLARMFLAGAKNLEVKKEWINELNLSIRLYLLITFKTVGF